MSFFYNNTLLLLTGKSKSRPHFQREISKLSANPVAIIPAVAAADGDSVKDSCSPSTCCATPKITITTANDDPVVVVHSPSPCHTEVIEKVSKEKRKSIKNDEMIQKKQKLVNSCLPYIPSVSPSSVSCSVVRDDYFCLLSEKKTFFGTKYYTR